MRHSSLGILFFAILSINFSRECFSFHFKLINFLRTPGASRKHAVKNTDRGEFSEQSELIHSGNLKKNSNSPSRLQIQEKTGFHSEITKIFPTEGNPAFDADKRLRQNDVDKLIYLHLPEFNQASISTLMYRSAKEWKKTKISVISRHIPRITSYMSRLPTDGWAAREIAHCVYGLQYMRSDDDSVLKFLSVMSNIILESLCSSDIETNENKAEETFDAEVLPSEKSMTSQPLPFIPAIFPLSHENEFRRNTNLSSSTEPLIDSKVLTARELSTMLYSLRGMRSDIKEVKVFLSSLNRALCLGGGAINDFDVQGVSTALYGLQGMDSDCSVVRTLVTQLIPKVAGCEGTLDSQAIGNALYGLKTMNSEYPEIRQLLKILAIKIDESRAELRPQEIANAIYGLQGMSSNYAEVKELISALARKINNSKKGQHLNAQEIGNTIYGLQNMNSDCLEVRNLLVAISKKMGNYDVIMTAQAVGCSLIGLQGLNSDHVEVSGLLSTLTKHISNSDIIDEKVVGSLFGLQRMNIDSNQVRQLLVVFSEKLDLCLGRLNIDEIAFAIYGLQNIVGTESPYKEVGIFLSALIRQIKRSVYLSSSFDDVDVVENKASHTVESVINSIKSVKHMCGANTQLGPQEIMSLLVVAECS